MKALLGDTAQKIMADKQGNEQLTQFIGSGESEGVIRLENGDEYIVSNLPSALIKEQEELDPEIHQSMVDNWWDLV